MSTYTNNFTRDKIVKTGLLMSVILLFLAFIYTVLIYSKLPPLIPVFNQLPWGLQRIGEKVMIFIPLILNVAFIFINLIFSNVVYDKMPLVVRMLGITSLFISFTVFVFIIRTSILLL